MLQEEINFIKNIAGKSYAFVLSRKFINPSQALSNSIQMGKVIHFEIPVDDLERAKKFYSEIFGWKLTDAPGEMQYTLANTVEVDENNMPKESGAINGGIMKRMFPEDRPVIVIDVSSIDEYVEKIKNRGCKLVMPKQQVGDMGLYARVTDSEGNVIGIWQNIRK